MKLNKQQTIAAHYSGSKDHLLVLAGAGTGKTRTIIGRAIFLLNNNIPAKGIVLLTFTRRAAAEMTHRLELEVGELAQGIFAGTFHRFCLDIIKTIPKAFGVENFTVIDPDDQASLIKLIRGTVLRDGEKKTFPQARKIIDLYSYARNTCKAPSDYLHKYTEYSKEIIEKLITVFNLYRQSDVIEHLYHDCMCLTICIFVCIYYPKVNTMRPLILEYAEERKGDIETVYEYDFAESLNVITVDNEKKAFIDSNAKDLSLLTKTKVKQETDEDYNLHLELLTKTYAHQEQDDKSFNNF